MINYELQVLKGHRRFGTFFLIRWFTQKSRNKREKKTYLKININIIYGAIVVATLHILQSPVFAILGR